MAVTMVPAAELLPDVLPSEHLLASGKPVPDLRADLRRIASIRNGFTVVAALAQTAGPVAAAILIGHPVAWIVAFVLMGRAHTLLGVLSHESAHRLLFRNQPLNDAVGRWLLSYPTFISFDGYRRGHFAHHKDELGPREPDLVLYSGYPISRASMRRKLVRDATGQSAYKILKGLGRGFRTKPNARDRVLRIGGTQLAIFAIFVLTGRPELYLLLWLAPWMTVTRTVGRLRAIAEHGGMIRSDDRRETTHHVVQSRLANFFMVPYNTGWHLAHHLDMGVPWRNLPEFHRVMVGDGYVPEEIVYANYRSLWRAMLTA